MLQNKLSQDAFDEVQGSFQMDDQFNVQEGYRNLRLCQGSILYLIVGLLGYATYGKNIEPNFLLSIEEKDVGAVLFVILNLSFVFSTTLTLLVILFGGRNNFIQMIKQFTENKKVNILAKKKLLDPQQNEQYYKELLQFRKKSQAIRFYGISILLFILLTIGAVLQKIQEMSIIYQEQSHVMQLIGITYFVLCILSKAGEKNEIPQQLKQIILFFHMWFIVCKHNSDNLMCNL